MHVIKQRKVARAHAVDACTCHARCPWCRQRCLGGHAAYPEQHWCAEGCDWDAERGPLG